MKELKTIRDLLLALLEGYEIERYFEPQNTWESVDSVCFDTRYLDDAEVMAEVGKHRIKPTKPSIDWSHVHPDYKCLVRNEDGRAILYKCKPELGRLGWYQHKEDCSNADSHKSYSPGNCHWTESLVERPE